MCAGYPGGQIDSCSGDSGGPLMQPLPNKEMKSFMYLIGVVSFGQMCGRSGSLGAYARVTHYMPWIEEKLLS
ncbi:Serine protease [Operophtera brumata]|uniref:Serine protease n=1 Tax=Operophtera brumata TaxID=104452 RepID=A0A0L7L628_OPEBR|nr:Serine protease [Operophtera brumata]